MDDMNAERGEYFKVELRETDSDDFDAQFQVSIIKWGDESKTRVVNDSRVIFLVLHGSWAVGGPKGGRKFELWGEKAVNPRNTSCQVKLYGKTRTVAFSPEARMAFLQDARSPLHEEYMRYFRGLNISLEPREAREAVTA
jgi:hypothetical protein